MATLLLENVFPMELNTFSPYCNNGEQYRKSGTICMGEGLREKLVHHGHYLHIIATVWVMILMGSALLNGITNLICSPLLCSKSHTTGLDGHVN